MLIIEIRANKTNLITLTAQNVSEQYGMKYGKGQQIYITDNGKKIKHKFEDGALTLAQKIIKSNLKQKKLI